MEPRPWIGLAIGIVLAVVITVTIEGIRRIRERRQSSGAVDAGAGAGGELPIPSRPTLRALFANFLQRFLRQST